MKNGDSNMQRTSVFMTRHQVAEIGKAAGEEGLYPAQIIRIAVSDWLARRKQSRGQK
jgi:hypothetical protein